MYKVTLVIGDAVVVNPILWHVGNIKLTFPTSPEKQAALAARAQCPYKPKPEIKVTFFEHFLVSICGLHFGRAKRNLIERQSVSSY